MDTVDAVFISALAVFCVLALIAMMWRAHHNIRECEKVIERARRARARDFRPPLDGLGEDQ